MIKEDVVNLKSGIGVNSKLKKGFGQWIPKFGAFVKIWILKSLNLN